MSVNPLDNTHFIFMPPTSMSVNPFDNTHFIFKPPTSMSVHSCSTYLPLTRRQAGRTSSMTRSYSWVCVRVCVRACVCARVSV